MLRTAYRNFYLLLKSKVWRPRIVTEHLIVVELVSGSVRLFAFHVVSVVCVLWKSSMAV